MGSTPRAELSSWRQMAGLALARFGVRADEIALLKCGENVTFRVRESSGETSLLRIHRPVYHAIEELRSELEWLAELGRSTELPVPRPKQTAGGEQVVAIDSPRGLGVHGCTLLEWMPGRQRFRSPFPAHLRAVGRTLAILHRQALSWIPPGAFRRPLLDWKGLLSRESNWGRFPSELPELFASEDRPAVEEALERIRVAMRTLDGLEESRTLIHADLHLGNVVFAGGVAVPIDFDDSGHGYLLYDLASSLIPYRQAPAWPALRDGFLEGYASVRTFPERQLDLLPEFLLVRRLTMALWLTSRQSLIPRLPRDLGPYLAGSAAMCRTLGR